MNAILKYPLEDVVFKTVLKPLPRNRLKALKRAVNVSGKWFAFFTRVDKRDFPNGIICFVPDRDELVK